jgi:alpha-glucosidase (family GH31 glycosyl hydrolase)
MPETAQPGVAVTIDTATVPLRIEALTHQVFRLAIGHRPFGSPSSYLPKASPPEHLSPERANDRGLVTDLASVACDDASRLIFRDADGRVLLRLVSDRLALAPAAHVRLELPVEQHLYGMGEGGAQFDRLGSVRRLWNFQANRAQGADIAVPLILSHLGYGLFIDNTARGRIETGDNNDGGTVLDYTAEPGPFDLYFFAGGMRAVLGAVAALLGKAALPPRWALGFLQSTRHFDGTEEILDLAAQMRERRLPCDAIIFLSTYGSARGLNRGVGHLDFQPDLFADPRAVLGALHARHFRTMSHEYPVVHERSPLYADAKARGYLLDHAYPRQTPAEPGAVIYKEGQRFIDFSRAEARAWWWDAHRELVAHGIAGWWLDGGEGPPAGTMLATGDAAIVHNRFDLWRQQCFAEGEARDRPERRPFLLCRSGGPGMSHLGAVPWSGDINTTFETMEQQIRIGLSLGLSGIPHWGTDAGGFYSVAPDQGELFVRWLQFAAFCTLFRAHGHLWRRHVPWAYGETIEAMCRATIELRYHLLPYTYTLVWQARRDGLPTMRPLVLNYPDDPNVWDLGTEYLWGDDLLVAPVTRRGATYWTVYLPTGTWHDYWTHEVYHGPAGVTVAAPLDRLPLFVRGGAIIPLGPVMQYEGERPLEDMTLLIYPEGSSSFTLYEDDGRTNGYLDGGYVETRIECHLESSGASLRIHPPVGDVSLLPTSRRYTVKLRAPCAPPKIVIDGAGTLEQPEWWYDGTHFLFIRMPRSPCTAHVEW